MVPRILIIDDEADIREVTALSLETIAGWQVILAALKPPACARITR